MFPPVSLRYLAAASGVAFFGLSGNMISNEHGAAIISGGRPDYCRTVPPPSPWTMTRCYCDGCRLCLAACASGLMNVNETAEVSLGGRSFQYAARRSYLRCQYVCGGFTGLHPSGKWSTWYSGRFPVPEQDAEFLPLLLAGVEKYAQLPQGAGGRYHSLMDNKLYTTCGNCQIVCHPDPEVRKAWYRLLAEGGVVVQNPDGSLEALTPDDAFLPAWNQ